MSPTQKSIHRVKSCSSKKTYATKSEADLKAMLSTVYAAKKIQSYFCVFCSKWHIGHPVEYAGILTK